MKSLLDDRTHGPRRSRSFFGFSCLVFVGGWLASCGQGGCVIFNHPFAPDGGTCRFDPLRFEQFLTVGEQAQVEFGLDEQCHADIQEVFPLRLAARVDVFDPTGKSVDHAAEKPERRQVGSSHFEDSVKVTFAVDRPGTWTLSADFGPELGRTVQNIEAVNWRGDARMRVIPWSVPLGCVGYEIDDLDTALCVTHERPSAPQILTSRGQVLEGNAFAVSGNVLWRLASFGGASGIERLEDDGTAFRATHRVLTAFATAGAVVADGDEAWVLGSATTSSGSLSLLHLTPEQDGGIAIQSTAVPGTAAAGVALGKDAALLFTGPWQMALATRDGGLVALEDTGHLVGADPEVLWLEDNADPLAEPNQQSGAQNLKVAWAGQGELRTPMLQLPRRCFLNPRHRIHFGAPLVPMSAVSGGPEAPVGSFAVPRFSGAQISLENFDAGTEFAPVSAVTRRHAFARALDGSALKIFER